MPSTLDKWINILVPWIILFIFAAIFYTKLKKPIDKVIEWIKGLFSAGAEAVSGTGEQVKEITYE